MSNPLNLPLLKALSEAAGVPGREERVREILRREGQALFDEISVDPLGSLIGVDLGHGFWSIGLARLIVWRPPRCG